MGRVTLPAWPVDPRDVNVEVDAPTFRVYFWRTSPGLACREFEVTGAVVDVVTEWADRNQHDAETYVLGVITHAVNPSPVDSHTVLTRIKGTDPSRSDNDGSGTRAAASG
jgi:hypothetical protein